MGCWGRGISFFSWNSGDSEQGENVGNGWAQKGFEFTVCGNEGAWSLGGRRLVEVSRLLMRAARWGKRIALH